MGEQWKQWQTLFSWAPGSLQMVTAAMKLKDTCSLDSILKSRDINLSTKVHLVKVMVFPVVIYGCESWAIKKAEHWRIDAFALWCWGRLLRVPWTARRSNLKEISPEYSLEGLILKLKLQYFGPLMRRTYSFEKTLMLGKIEDGRRRGKQDERVRSHHHLNEHQFDQALGVGDGQGSLASMLKSMGLESWTRLSDWNERHIGLP